ncbi:hypothetical protein ACMG2F_001745, partial [Campylobacter coli]
MFSKILSALSLANSFKAMIFKRLSSPVQSAYLGSLVWDIINILNGDQQDSEKICQILDLLSDFKNKHPEDFDKIVDILKEILDEYEKNPSEVKKNLKDFSNMQNLLILYNPYYQQDVIKLHLEILLDKGQVAFGKIKSKLKEPLSYERDENKISHNQKLSEIYKNTSADNPLQLFLSDYANLFVAKVVKISKEV